MKNTHVKFAMVAAAAFAVALVSAPNASAATATATIAVSATVTNSCTATAGSLAFTTGYSSATTTPTTATGTFTVNCTLDGSYTIALDKGQGTGASLATRYMMNGTNKLGYTIYTASSGPTVWGDGTGSTATVPGTGNGSNQTISVFGSIPANQPAFAGSYADQVTATITY